MSVVDSNRKRGKRTEAAIAKRMDGKRVGLYGGQDIEHDTWSIEVKNRQKCVVESFMNQAIRNCDLFKMPMVIIHIHGQRHDKDLVVIRLRDWEEMYGSLYQQRANLKGD